MDKSYCFMSIKKNLQKKSSLQKRKDLWEYPKTISILNFKNLYKSKILLKYDYVNC